MPGIEIGLGAGVQRDVPGGEPDQEGAGLGDLLTGFLRRAGAQRALGCLGAELAELVPGGEVLEHAGVFGVGGGGDALGEPPLEQQESAVEVGQDTAVHEQVAEVDGGPPVRQSLDGVVCERHCSGGEVP
ncbi:hypothetical protein [Streptomyces sp. NPDC056683]|uniref:hypothetical protein n=1 Tax=Streptomyces sp. NPDC056683 TaxID=3345910 RepID=UPI00368F2486